MVRRTFATLLAALVLRATKSEAQVEWGDARRYARGSVSAMVTPELSLSPAFTARLLLDVTLRLNMLGGFTVQPRAGIGAGGSIPGGGVTTASRFGVGLGGTFAVHRSVALSPMVAYDVFVFAGVGVFAPTLVHRAVIELPVTLVLGAHALAEFFVQGGVGYGNYAFDLGLGAGIRFGITFATAPQMAAR